ncbi:tetratricopeptide repeat protein [Deferrisoma camini]|uniref:tetratricopeptide repeat protein n=1 Tax=Deferrisoma camini TaxID=1035120 RepID=UPI00046D05AA|nr:tetratricopeptide repeat protein [Deferrisoma camini]
MAFGWFGKRRSSLEQLVEKGRKLARQGRWGEALAYLEDAAGRPDAPPELGDEIRACRARLAEINLEEARECLAASDPGRAREHLALARKYAAGDPGLAARIEACEAELSPPEPQPRGPARPVFAPSCGCDAPCEPEPPTEEEAAPADTDLFEFYLEAVDPAERAVLTGLGEAFRAGFVALQQGDLDEAGRRLGEAAAEHPGAAGPAYALGVLHSLRGEWAEAEARFKEALAAAPDLAAAVHHWADTLREAGQTERAVRLLERWVEDHPEDGPSWVRLAALRLDGGDPEAALAALDPAAQSFSEPPPEVGLLRARTLEALGRTDDAVTELQGVLARRPDLVEALVPLGRILLARGGVHAERAAEVFKHCVRIDPGRGWWYLLRVAEAYAARGWAAEAREILDHAAARLPEDEEAREEWDRVAGSLTN